MPTGTGTAPWKIEVKQNFVHFSDLFLKEHTPIHRGTGPGGPVNGSSMASCYHVYITGNLPMGAEVTLTVLVPTIGRASDNGCSLPVCVHWLHSARGLYKGEWVSACRFRVLDIDCEIAVLVQKGERTVRCEREDKNHKIWKGIILKRLEPHSWRSRNKQRKFKEHSWKANSSMEGETWESTFFPPCYTVQCIHQ